MNMPRSFVTVSGLLFCIAASGCGSGEKTVLVRGKIVQGGAAYNPTQDIKGPIPPEDPGIRVVFTRTGDKAGEEYVAVVNRDAGTFEVPGNAGNGIPVARYQVKVYVGAFGGSPPQAGDKALGKIPLEYRTDAQKKDRAAFSYGVEMASMEVDVTDSGSSDVTIEVKKK